MSQPGTEWVQFNFYLKIKAIFLLSFCLSHRGEPSQFPSSSHFSSVWRKSATSKLQNLIHLNRSRYHNSYEPLSQNLWTPCTPNISDNQVYLSPLVSLGTVFLCKYTCNTSKVKDALKIIFPSNLSTSFAPFHKVKLSLCLSQFLVHCPIK